MTNRRALMVAIVCVMTTIVVASQTPPTLAATDRWGTRLPTDDPIVNAGQTIEFAGTCPGAPDGSATEVRYQIDDVVFYPGRAMIPRTTVSVEIMNEKFGYRYTIPYRSTFAQPTTGRLVYSTMTYSASCPTGPLIPKPGTVLANRSGSLYVFPEESNEPFTPLPVPVRTLDSRPATTVGDYSTPWSAGESRVVQVAGRSGVPFGATVAVVNITVTHPVEPGFLTASRAGEPTPAVSTTNFRRGQTRSANAWVPLDGLGRMAIYSQSETDLIVDVVGYTGGDGRTNGRGSGMETVEPARLVDRRLAAGQSQTIEVDSGGIWTETPTAVVVNITVEAGAGAGYVTASSAVVPPLGTTSTVNFADGETISNLAVVPVDAATKSITVRTSADARVVVDVQGYFFLSPGVEHQTYTVIEPRRVAGRTWESDPLTAQSVGGTDRRFAMVGTWARWQSEVLTRTVILNVTVADPTLDSYLRVTAMPGTHSTSNLNAVAGVAQSNHTLIAVGTGGTATVHLQQGASHVLIDIEGYFS